MARKFNSDATYKRFDTATAKINAYALVDDFVSADAAGRVVIKYPRDGAGRVRAFVQLWGLPMVDAWAEGYGYDKTSAAVVGAVKVLLSLPVDEVGQDSAVLQRLEALRVAAAAHNEGYDWQRLFESADFAIHRAI